MTDAPTPQNARRIITPEQARRAFYVDFEGRKATPDMLLGVLWQRYRKGPPSLRHYLVDPRLAPIAECIEVDAEIAEQEWEVKETRSAVEDILRLARRQKRLIVAWSQHDFGVIANGQPLSRFQRVYLVRLYRDGKETARKWVNRGVAGMRLPPGKKHALDRYQRMIGYDVPEEFGLGKTGENLGKLVEALEKRGSWDALTDRQQERAREVVGHNFCDLEGMREIVIRAAEELAADRS